MHFPKIRLLANALYTLIFFLLSVFFGYALLKLWQDQTWGILAVSLFCTGGSLFAMIFSLREALSARRAIREKAAAKQREKPRPLTEHLNASETAQLLMQVFDFTPADLALNQLGRLSPRQKNRYFSPLPHFIKMVVLFVIVVGLILLGIEKLGTTSPTEKHIGSGFVIVLSVIGLIMDVRTRQRLSKGQISTSCGAVTLKINQLGDVIEHCAIIAGETFTIGPWQYETLVQDRPYCFYWIALAGYTRGKVILSVTQS